ncbi:MAG: 3-isopropylmalate dehydratase small subunit [Gemmatimonadetes bacterium]|nr:3-isopropylmalate dehydratase small subunit [Gemmatimonadota bacterium]
MSGEAFCTFRSRAVLLLRDDVDTDQIIPARFLTTTERTGLGRYAFADWRLDAAGAPRVDFPLNAPDAVGARVLVAGRNFGCGSSREHAPWALIDWGFRAIIAESFGDIFRNNAHKNGLLTIAVDSDAHARLVGAVTSQPDTEVTVDLVERSLQVANASPEQFEIDRFVRHCLTVGIDELDYLLAAEREITSWERGAPEFTATFDEASSGSWRGGGVRRSRRYRP